MKTITLILLILAIMYVSIDLFFTYLIDKWEKEYQKKNN